MAETVGSLIDKITIVDLKAYHMQEQVERKDTSEDHRKACQKKVTILIEQREDLSQELSSLIEAVRNRTKRIKVYRQFKMYNDPIYRKAST